MLTSKRVIKSTERKSKENRREKTKQVNQERAEKADSR
jgi:hypothetical protein